MKVTNDNLLEVAAKQVSSRFGFYTDEAMLRPVGIQRHGTTRVVMISLSEYERLKRRDRQVKYVKDLTDDEIHAIKTAKPGKASRALDDLMADTGAG
ncbi:type II toxin-antitoxin system Phd/YefM family antitoxin [Pacificimonas sp. WHA3]|uniref:Type II toxin-antitoxin system Phd/YefM family antitoxin n=1 Tax=Pacificimonas pallii TaxID=2827236 RepID=A0ABS6SFK6_9SPHN|nr:type II toxin-antitoxin system Phd/YefM family antitoxin [Pacificimonas pallii]MBV7257182.1 type II toxin-antitoxin system Phd/YefM family antitoxin [Pacificimonas pallii]